jgi:hypothetical protein
VRAAHSSMPHRPCAALCATRCAAACCRRPRRSLPKVGRRAGRRARSVAEAALALPVGAADAAPVQRRQPQRGSRVPVAPEASPNGSTTAKGLALSVARPRPGWSSVEKSNERASKASERQAAFWSRARWKIRETGPVDK